MENLNTIETNDELAITLTAHELDDRSVNEGSLREKQSRIRKLFRAGWKVRELAEKFNVSYEWARRIAKNVAYDYDDVTVEAAADDLAVPVAF